MVKLEEKARRAFNGARRRLDLPDRTDEDFASLYWPLAAWLSERARGRARPFVFGLNGAQGAGKSTFCELLSVVLEVGFMASVVVLSIDDVYLTRSERLQLAQRVHPLCAVRGAPGTHDLALAHALVDQLSCAGPDELTALPRFDKAQDDRKPRDAWDEFRGRPAIILFEGWCVAARSCTVWEGPYNEREAREDPEGIWSRWSEAALAKEYVSFFARLDALGMIKVPSMDTVRQGRWLQEQMLHERLRAEGLQEGYAGLMNREEVLNYVALFERQTERMLSEMPQRADVLILRDEDFQYRLATAPWICDAAVP